MEICSMDADSLLSNSGEYVYSLDTATPLSIAIRRVLHD